MDVYALDSDFNLVTVGIPYDNLQWNRKYYEAGDFEMQVSLSQYDPSWKFIGRPDRRELGMVQRVYQPEDSYDTVIIGGFFCEKMLDEKTCYPRYIGDAPKTETAVRNIFSKYKDDLPIGLATANEPLMGDRTQSDFSDDQLGDKIYRILESRELSYRVTYDFAYNRLEFGVWQGVDRTQSQSANSYQVFATDFANILARSIDFDESDYKNYAIIPCDGDEADNRERKTLYIDLSNGERHREVVIDMRASHPEDGQSAADFEAAVKQEAMERLLSYERIEDVDIQPTSGYMETFDLGDKCDVVMPDIGIEMESRIIEVYEVYKADGNSVTVGLGNKRISNMRRAVSSL